MISIEEFYKSNKVNKDFNEKKYLLDNPEVKDFYQPYCSDNGITERERLYFHYAIHYSQYKNPFTLKLMVFTQLIEKLMILNTERYKSPLHHDADLSKLISEYIGVTFSSLLLPNIVHNYEERQEALQRCRKILPFVKRLTIRDEWTEDGKVMT